MDPFSNDKVSLLVLHHLQSRTEVPNLLLHWGNVLVIANKEDAVHIEAMMVMSG